jgi:hypothetical protein
VPLSAASIALQELNGSIEEEVQRVRRGPLDEDVFSRRIGLVGQLRGDRLKGLVGDVAQEVGET